MVESWHNFLWYMLNSETIKVILHRFIWSDLGVRWTLDPYRWDSVDERLVESDIKGFGQLVHVLMVGLSFLQGIQEYGAAFKDNWRHGIKVHDC